MEVSSSPLISPDMCIKFDMRLTTGLLITLLGFSQSAFCWQDSGTKPGAPIPNAVQSPKDQDTGQSTEVWVRPNSLYVHLDLLSKHAQSSEWARQTARILEQFIGTPIADPQSQVYFELFQKQVDEVQRLLAQISTQTKRSGGNSTVSIYLMRARYSLQRRLSIWRAVHEISGIQYKHKDESQDHRVFAISKARFSFEEVEAGWAEYLELDAAERAFNSIHSKRGAQKTAARKVLGRLYSPALSASQQKFLHKIIDQELNTLIRRQAVEPVQLQRFLERVEYFESEGNGASQHYLNDDYQNFLWTGDEKYSQVANLLQAHYRNANIRITVSEKLLNNMVPELPDESEPFRDNVLGANVVGQNEISDVLLKIKLLPNPHQIAMRLETTGQIHSNTKAYQSGVTVDNMGSSRFQVMKRLMFGRNGVSSESAQAYSQTNQQVVGIRSQMDGVPILGWLTRRVAQQKIQQQAPLTRQYTQNKVQRTATQRVEQEVQTNLNQMRNYINNNILAPLIALDLDPDPIETSTNRNDVVMRYRLAGRDQMASNTARPRELPQSLMSIQLHESVLNNVLSRMEIAGKKFTPQQLAKHLNQMLGVDVLSGAEELDSKVEFEFAPFDPVRLDFEGNQIQLTVNLKSLRINKGKRWKNLTAKTRYNPAARGMDIWLTKSEAGTELSGRKKLRLPDQIAIRTVFKVLFEDRFEFPALPSSVADQLGTDALRINQFIVSNGWVGISVNEKEGQLPHYQAARNVEPPTKTSSRGRAAQPIGR